MTVPVGADGKVLLYNGSSGKTQLIADFAGFYLGGTASAPGTFVPVIPTRVLDTRTYTGTGTEGPLAAGGSADFPVTAEGVPPDASSVMLNLTAVSPTASGYLTLFPSGQTRPGTSNLNFPAGHTVANLALTGASTDGKVNVYNGSGGQTQILADLFGYFRS